MSWVTIIWSMIAAACLTLGAVHLLVWCQRRAAWADLFFTLASVSVAFYAGCELALMRAATPAQFATALRWLHVPAWGLVLSLVGFVHFHLRAGRAWLGWGTCALRSVALLLNFLIGQNLNYREVTSLRQVRFLGESVAVGVGVANPWMLIGQLSLLFFLLFTADAALTVWRRGDRRASLVTGGSIVFFALIGVVQAVLVLWQIVDLPLTASFFYLGIVVATGYEMSRDTLWAAQLSDALRESEARMTLAAEAAGFGVWMWNVETNRVWGSERALRLFEFPLNADVSFDQVIQRVHPDDRERVAATRDRAIQTRGNYATEYRILLADGGQRWIASRGRFYLSGDGKPARMIGVVVDVTDRKQADQELVQKRNELAHIARVSTMGELAASVAHELNQPLGAILRNAEAAELFLQAASPDLEELRAIRADIRADDARAGAVIDRRRSLLKRREIEHVSLDLKQLAREVVNLVRTEADVRKIQLALEPGAPPPTVCGDRAQLQQVLLNLLLNAMDAVTDSPKDCRRVSMDVRAAGSQVEVVVSDTGRGIPADKAARVFEAFFTTKPNGLGMGLAISQSIIKAHNGNIRWRNNPAGGTTFCVTLPVANKEHAP